MSNQHDPEASFNLRSGRGLGFTVCCFKLNVAEKLGAAEPAADEELVHNLGGPKKKATWRLKEVFVLLTISFHRERMLFLFINKIASFSLDIYI